MWPHCGKQISDITDISDWLYKTICCVSFPSLKSNLLKISSCTNYITTLSEIQDSNFQKLISFSWLSLVLFWQLQPWSNKYTSLDKHRDISNLISVQLKVMCLYLPSHMPVAFWIVTATQEVSFLVEHVLFTVTTEPLLSSKRSFGLLMFHPALSVFSSYVQFNTTSDSYFTIDPGVFIVTIPIWRKISEWVIMIKHEQGGRGFEWSSPYSIQDCCLKRDTCPVQQCMITCPRHDWKWLWLMWETKDGLSTSVLNIHEYWQIPSHCLQVMMTDF